LPLYVVADDNGTEGGDVNTVALIGNLATDVELRELGGDRKVAGFLLAIDRSSGDEADFVWVSAWDRQAEVCAQFLRKGRRVGVDGRIRSHSWEEEGKRRTKVDVVANRVEFLHGAADGGGGGAADDIPFEAVPA
jgi:single-strand DNA-binding protein